MLSAWEQKNSLVLGQVAIQQLQRLIKIYAYWWGFYCLLPMKVIFLSDSQSIVPLVLQHIEPLTPFHEPVPLYGFHQRTNAHQNADQIRSWG